MKDEEEANIGKGDMRREEEGRRMRGRQRLGRRDEEGIGRMKDEGRQI